MWKLVWIALVWLAFALIIPHPLHAQRGANFSRNISLVDSPLQGFPGYFDTQMAEKGHFVFDLPPAVNLVPLPASTLDYGATERLTVGTNVGATLLPLLLGGFGLSGKVRALVYGDSTIQSSITAYGGFMRFSGGGSDDEDDSEDDDSDDNDADVASSFLNVDYEHLSSNTSWHIDRNRILTGQIALSRFGLQVNNRNDLDYVSLSMFLIFLGGQYQHFFTEKFGLEVAGMYPVYQRLALDSVGVAVALQSDTVNFKNALFALGRASAQYKYHKWVFNLGLLHMPPFAEVGIWFGAGFKI